MAFWGVRCNATYVEKVVMNDSKRNCQTIVWRMVSTTKLLFTLFLKVQFFIYDPAALDVDLPIYQNWEGTVNGKSDNNIRVVNWILVWQRSGQDQGVNAVPWPLISDGVTNFNAESFLNGLGNIKSVSTNVFNSDTVRNNCGPNS